MDRAPVLLPVELSGELLRVVMREGSLGESAFHTHACGQLLYPERGAALLETPDRLVRLGPSRAAWIPPDLPHVVLMERPYRYHSVYISGEHCRGSAFSVRAVSPLLKALILDAASWRDSVAGSPSRYWKMRVIQDEIQQASSVEAGLSIPADPRVAAVCRVLEKDPSNPCSLLDWAAQIGISDRTLQRAFIKGTGMSFQQWRNYARMSRALELHSRGYRVLDVAMELGYSSESAYSQAFKQFYGYSPGKLKTKTPPR